MGDNENSPTLARGSSSRKPNSFDCPHCGAFAYHQKGPVYWFQGGATKKRDGLTVTASASEGRQLSHFQFRKCVSCGKFSIWQEKTLVHPSKASGPNPHEKMPDDVKRDFEEARHVVDDSPRSAAALLRLAIQRMVENHLEAEGRTLYDKIGDLVEKGRIDSQIQKALDSVRVIGNNSVHPGEMDMDDDRETAIALFKLINAIVDETIGRQNMIEDVYENLPEGPKEGIEQRDKK